MLIKDRKLYYSAGELAGLFGIPKQTMFYYVKMGLLVPDYIADNGYRYFGDDQYLHMEIIYFLRKLDISVPDIKAYLRSNDLDKLRKLLAAKRKHCAAIIRHQQGLIKILEACEDRLASSRHLLLDQVLLKDYPEKYYIVSTYATASGPCYGNPRNDPEMLQPDIGPITTRAAHVSKLFANRDFKDRATGWIVLREKFFYGNPRQSFAVMTEIFAEDGIQKANFVSPAGSYLVLHLKGRLLPQRRTRQQDDGPVPGAEPNGGCGRCLRQAAHRLLEHVRSVSICQYPIVASRAPCFRRLTHP